MFSKFMKWKVLKNFVRKLNQIQNENFIKDTFNGSSTEYSAIQKC